MTTSTIEIFARPVELTFGLAQHICIVSTDSQGNLADLIESNSFKKVIRTRDVFSRISEPSKYAS